MRQAFALPFVALLASCATAPEPTAGGNRPAAPGGFVRLDQPVQVGRFVAIPLAVIEDSRCPRIAICVWAGRLIVSTRLQGAGWRETVLLTMNKPYATHGTTITLASADPPQDEAVEQPGKYRFAFSGGD